MTVTNYLSMKTFFSKHVGRIYAGQWLTDETYNKLTAQEKNYVMLRKPYTTFPMDSLYGFGLIFKSEEFPHPESKVIK